MTIPEDENRSFNPQEVMVVAKAGEVAQTRTLEELSEALHTLGFQLHAHEGLLFSVLQTDEANNAVVARYWDNRGRVVKTEYIGDFGHAGKGKFTSNYSYDAQGRLVKFEQVVTPTEGGEFIFRKEEYKYIEGQSNHEYTLVYYECYKGPGGPIQAYEVTFEARQIKRGAQPHESPPKNP